MVQLTWRGFKVLWKGLDIPMVLWFWKVMGWSDRVSLVLYIIEIVIFRLFKKKIRQSFNVNINGFRFLIKPNVGDLGMIYEILGKKIYEIDNNFIPRDGDICMDIGANIGCVSLSWAKCNCTGLIVTVEPHPDTFQRLANNIKVNAVTNIIPVHAAAGSHSGVLALYQQDDSSMAIVGEAAADRMPGTAPLETVPALTLDELSRQLHKAKVHLLKLDVEGFEVECLRGATELLQITDKIILEHHSPALRQECLEILSCSGFSVQEVGQLFFCRKD